MPAPRFGQKLGTLRASPLANLRLLFADLRGLRKFLELQHHFVEVGPSLSDVELLGTATNEELELLPRKIEPNFGGVEDLTLRVSFFRELERLVDLLVVERVAAQLHCLKFRFTLIELAIEAAFLDAEIGEIFAEGHENFGL